MISLNVIKYNGVILYRGESELGGKIVAIATGMRNGSKNTKTGDFIQTYILSDEGERPTDAQNSGKDASICGDCIHRKTDWGTCYVNVGQAPNQVYQAYKNGSYGEALNIEHFRDRIIRLGAYGDPAAVPILVWEKICEVSAGWTGYTHQWRRCNPELKKYLMASVETTEAQLRARKMGWKTFRIRNSDEPLNSHEFVCPASEEAGKRMQCEDCLACCGGSWNGKQVTPAIVAHGSHYKPIRFRKMQKLMRMKKRYRYLHPEVAPK